jgi:hypothetical protein
VKSNLVKELRALDITPSASAATGKLQVSYGRPSVDTLQSESVYFSGEMRTQGDDEQRLSGARQVRQRAWEVELIVSSVILSDTEAAETRAMTIVKAIENWLASNAQPAEWPNYPVASGALFVVPTSIEVEQQEHVEGMLSVEVIMYLRVMERLQ